MNRYQLAKLVSWAGQLQARKRLQKVVYMLQAAGCPFDADYILHHYGPYSEGLARLTDEMVRNTLLEEKPHDMPMGKQYSYQVSEAAQKEIRDLEATEQGKRWAEELAPFETRAKELLAADLKQLEYASTIVYFRRQGLAWDTAVEKATTFKNTMAVKAALPLAKTVIA
jgi:uncharacterized protein YwgA